MSRTIARLLMSLGRLVVPPLFAEEAPAKLNWRLASANEVYEDGATLLFSQAENRMSCAGLESE